MTIMLKVPSWVPSVGARERVCVDMFVVVKVIQLGRVV